MGAGCGAHGRRLSQEQKDGKTLFAVAPCGSNSVLRAPIQDARSTGVVSLNVGGHMFSISRAKLAESRSSVFRKLVASPPGADGAYFLDRDGRHFRHVLNFMRDGPDFCVPASVEMRRELRHEARMLDLPDLVNILTDETIQSPGDKGIPEEYGCPIPSNEHLRLQRLEGLGILNSDTQDRRFDNITAVIRHLFEVPVVLVTIVHEYQTWFKSRQGLDGCSADRNDTFCAYNFVPPDPKEAAMLVVEDLQQDYRFYRNPLVTDGGFRFYAGSPLVLSDGLRLGALCSLDYQTRTITPQQAQILTNFSTIVSQEIERHQLLARQGSSSDKIRGGPPPTNGDYAAGPLRAERMRMALSEAVLLVRVRTDGLQWPVLYASENFGDFTNVHVKSPGLPSEIPTIWGTGQMALLWEILQPSSHDRERLCSDLSASWRRSEPEVFFVQSKFIVSGKEATATYKVHLRFSPADHPLDVNAAAVRIVPGRRMYTIGGNGSPPSEHLFFVTAVFDDAPVEAEQHVFTSPPAVIPMAEDKHISKRKRRLLGIKHDPDTGSRDSLSALDSIKPPIPPFVDVVLVRRVAEGSFASVYYGLWCGSPVAVKVLLHRNIAGSSGSRGSRGSQGSLDSSLGARFEASLSASISHPNLVQTYKHSTRLSAPNASSPLVPGQVATALAQIPETWIVQQWCECGTLGNFCDKPGEKLPTIDAVEACVEIARGVSYLHSRDIVHGDLSPNNVLFKGEVSRKGFVCKICDFGLARVGGANEIKMGAIGTITHMPPERVTSDISTNKVDVYSCGILFWQLVTRQRPFAGMQWTQVVFQVCEGRCPEMPPDEHNELQDTYRGCTSFNPDHRPEMDAVTSRLGALMLELEKHNTGAGDVLRPAIRQTSAPPEQPTALLD